MKLLLIGAGYVGITLLRYIQDQEYEIFVTTTDPNKVELLKPYAKDVILLKSADDLNKAIADCDAIILTIAPKKNQNYEETYLNTAKNISLSVSKREKPPYILYTSSTSVYEGIEEKWATEDLPLHPKSEKGQILLQTEKLLLDCSKTCILRLGGIFGPGREISKRVQSLTGKELPGTGDEPTNHIHLEDIVKGISFCLSHHLIGIYNLVNNDHPTKKELYSPLCHFNPNLSHNSKGYKVSNNKIVSVGFTPTKSCNN